MLNVNSFFRSRPSGFCGACVLTGLVLVTGTAAADSGWVLLNEAKINPPGSDNPYEYVELLGDPGLTLTNVYLFGIEGDDDEDPGTVDLQIDLSGAHLGSNGLLLLVGSGHPYAPPPATSILTNSAFDTSGGTLEDGDSSYLLVTSPEPLEDLVDQDLDAGDNGTLEGAPEGFTILDAIGWKGGTRTMWSTAGPN